MVLDVDTSLIDGKPALPPGALTWVLPIGRYLRRHPDAQAEGEEDGSDHGRKRRRRRSLPPLDATVARYG
jgi:hypothetical protein